MARASVQILFSGDTPWVTGSTPVAPTYPTVEEGETVYLFVHNKPSTATPTTPTNWTLVGTATGGAGTNGNDTGPTRMTVFKRVAGAGGLSGSQSVTITGATVSAACMVAWAAVGQNVAFEEAFTSWSKTSVVSSAFGGTAAAGIVVAREDRVHVMAGTTSDLQTGLAVTGISATGATFGTLFRGPDQAVVTTTGPDLSVVMYDVLVTAGSSSAAPVVTVTADAGGTNSGMGFVMRIRATADVIADTLDPGDIEVEGAPINVALNAHLDPGDVEIEGTSFDVDLIPRVRRPSDIIDVTVEGPDVTVSKIYPLDIQDIVVETVDATGMHHVVNLPAADVVVEPLTATLLGTNLEPGDIELQGPPIQVSYGSTGPAGGGGVIAVPPSNTTRFIVQSVLDGRFLTWDLPLNDPLITYTLSGPTSITGELRPEDPGIQDLIALGMEPWACWIHVETDGYIRASGLLTPYQVDDETMSIEAVGPSGYAHGIPYLAELSGIQIDPADVMRAIWAHLQSYPDGKLGVTVHGTTPVKIGEPARTEQELDENGNPKFDENGAPVMREVEAKPYELMWWEGVDCGAEINSLATAAPFDYIERCAWSDATKTSVRHWIDLGHPRLGARRTDLRFATGENVTSAIPAEETDDLYASQVVLFGAGEGRATVKGYAGRPLRKRLRRVAIIQDATVSDTARATALSGSDLERRQGLIDVTDIEIDARHINAQIGSFDVGDDILLDVEAGWLGRLLQWERVLSITYAPDGEAVRLQLRRADAFRYGGVA